MDKQKIKLTYPNGTETVFDSIKEAADELGFTWTGLYYGLKRGYIMKNVKITKIFFSSEN